MKITNKQIQLIGYSLTIGFILLLLIKGTLDLAQWNETYDFNFQNPIRIDVREKPITHRSIKEAEAKPVDPATLSTEDYICYVFGTQCQTALQVAKAESGMRCDALNINTNKTVDLSIFQINSVHLKKGWKLADLADCRKNIEYAKQLYAEQGWCIWVAYQKLYPSKCK